MKVRIVFENNRYYVESKFLSLFGTKCKVNFPTYDEAFQCANELIENKKSRKTKIIYEKIEI